MKPLKTAHLPPILRRDVDAWHAEIAAAQMKLERSVAQAKRTKSAADRRAVDEAVDALNAVTARSADLTRRVRTFSGKPSGAVARATPAAAPTTPAIPLPSFSPVRAKLAEVQAAIADLERAVDDRKARDAAPSTPSAVAPRFTARDLN